MLIIWMAVLLASIAAVAGITVAIRTNQVAITTWLRNNYQRLAYGAGIIGGLSLLGLLTFSHPITVLLIALIVVAIAAVVMNWTAVGPFLRAYWFRIIASFVIVGFGLWFITRLRALPPSMLLLWSVIAAIVMAMIVFWSAMWRFVRASWRPILVVVTLLILVVAFTRAATPIRSAVTGWWGEVTAYGGRNSSPSSRLSGATPMFRVKTEAEIANCLRRLANTPPYLDPESERAQAACR